MKISHLVFGIVPLLGLLVASGGCKPTEKNYQAAYDAAIRKRQSDSLAMVPDVGGHKVIAFDAPRIIAVGGSDIRIITCFTKPLDDLAAQFPKKRYSVAVGKYRMPTNARAQAESLVGSGFPDAVVVTDGRDVYYTVAARYDVLEQAAECVGKLMSMLPSSSFVGLEGEPLLIQSP